ncbi:polysaccharide deacetylase family protein [Paenibacillus radicis (ex Gao et al. 2016)]|uniref:Polysaccharide deacetylase n=1 Tax=Paenibacillus radicis (ex Gao et al. 2016) TaxID=1737354 RepID=A0A917GP68_9BACL|nr:polysaccharide deacetylase family protein [Paenibacillus radicis (ex Gao et al. 2016)]GGG52778.1 polysaccharide deacetylase [Paenibacillus radicis (ex Gao et al. 2016)]
MDFQYSYQKSSKDFTPKNNKPPRKRKINYRKMIIVIVALALLIFGTIYVSVDLVTTWRKHDLKTDIPVRESLQNQPHIDASPTPKADENQAAPLKVVYLTFDDGPSKYTNDILNILKEHGAKATFFMIGSHLNRHKDEVKRIVEEGSYPGLHSMSHDVNKLYKSGGSSRFIEEFKQEQELVKDIVGFAPDLIRAPYGSKPHVDEVFRGDIAEAGFRMWDWTVDSLDWNLPDKPDKIAEQVSQSIHRDLEVILLHEREQTVEALPKILDILHDCGYEFKAYDSSEHVIANFSGDSRL